MPISFEKMHETINSGPNPKTDACLFNAYTAFIVFCVSVKTKEAIDCRFNFEMKDVFEI